LLDRIAILPTGPLDAAVRPPGSKSITNRALICAALASGSSVLRGTLDSEDTRVMLDSLTRLGLAIEIEESAPAPFAAGVARQIANSDLTVRITGCGGRFPVREADLYCANSGTTIRFLTAALAAGNGVYRLDGVQRMRERPIEDLLAALRQLGCDAESEVGTGCPPVIVRAKGLRGGAAGIRGNISSQFLSGLLMAAPYAQSDVELVVAGELVSQPYVRMTLGVMREFGVDLPEASVTNIRIAAPQVYRGTQFAIEPDASAASYFWGAAAIAGGSVRVAGLTRKALQGDVRFVECLAQMGCQVAFEENGITVSGHAVRGIDVDMNDISDTVQTLSAVALFVAGPTRIRNVGHIRHKETDRIGDLARELRKFGARIEEHVDGLTIIPPSDPAKLQGAVIETYRDHRMAMSLALVGLRVPGVVINDPGCTAKTYPRFFDDLGRLMNGS
jgi:3-phosphoshikimate 1-carboxyvinyltransferase